MNKFGKKPLIFLDMDGVIADFMQSALRPHFGDDWASKLALTPRGVFDCYEPMGLTSDEFWDTINDLGVAFWSCLDTYPWTTELISGCRELGDICILSSPSRHPACVAGKVRWLQRIMGENFRDYIFAPKQHKHLLAGPNRYLVEDTTKNAVEFMTSGGAGTVLVPQHWNTQPFVAADAVAPMVLTALKEMICTAK